MAGSVSEWIVGLKAEDAEAIQQLWDRYQHQLLAIARRRIEPRLRQVADEEDILVSVFDTICKAAAAGRFAHMSDRDDLWWLLLSVTHRKIVDHIRQMRRKKRGHGKVTRESEMPDSSKPFQLAEVIGKSPTPEILASMDEEYNRLLGVLRDDQLRRIAIWRCEGLKVDEISNRLNLSMRSVERKLNLIRNQWLAEVNL